jgi:hypothetical protein
MPAGEAHRPWDGATSVGLCVKAVKPIPHTNPIPKNRLKNLNMPDYCDFIIAIASKLANNTLRF